MQGFLRGKCFAAQLIKGFSWSQGHDKINGRCIIPQKGRRTNKAVDEARGMLHFPLRVISQHDEFILSCRMSMLKRHRSLESKELSCFILDFKNESIRPCAELGDSGILMFFGAETGWQRSWALRSRKRALT